MGKVKKALYAKEEVKVKKKALYAKEEEKVRKKLYMLHGPEWAALHRGEA